MSQRQHGSKMHKRQSILCLFALFLALFSLPLLSSAAELSATVDRSEVGENETLHLSVRSSQHVRYGNPDFRALEQDFDILGQQRSSQFHSINGRTEAFTEWKLTLAPKRSGTLQIPSFTFEGATSKPLTITVKEPKDMATTPEVSELYVEVEADKDELYVQEQLLVTMRVHAAVVLRDLSMDSDLKVEGAVVERVAETSYTRDENGRLYQVIELVYAVYPQRSGSLTIPALTWNAMVATDHGSSLRYRFQTPAELRRLRSDALHLEVKPQPSQFRGSHWLPAESVVLEEHWNRDPSRFVVGEPLTRTITIRAEGLTSAQLPPLPQQDIPGMRLYSDQPQYDDMRSGEGIVGHRTESVAMVPNRSGDLHLPAVEVSWWDTRNDVMRTARLPARTVKVAPASDTADGQSLTPQDVEAGAVAEDGGDALPSTSGVSWLWILSNIVFAALAVTFMLAWLRLRQQTAAQEDHEESAEDPRLNAALQRVRRACAENDARAARQAIDIWSRLYWELPHPASREEIARWSGSESLSRELAKLDEILYGNQQHASWQGNKLWKALVQFKRDDKNNRRQQTGKNQNNNLAPLYPN